MVFHKAVNTKELFNLNRKPNINKKALPTANSVMPFKLVIYL